LTESGPLPAGLSFTDNGNAAITGTPANGSSGRYRITITATNASGTNTRPVILLISRIEQADNRHSPPACVPSPGTADCQVTVDQVYIGQTGRGDQCPACGECDLRPYGNGSKWARPRCHFILPCWEGGELAWAPRHRARAATYELTVPRSRLRALPPHGGTLPQAIQSIVGRIARSGVPMSSGL
jgi:hypothetical protein